MSVEKEIFNYLYELGVCKACCLRYLCVRQQDVYDQIDNYIKEKEYLSTSEIEIVGKKIKTNACIICLGLLQDFCINEIVDKIVSNENVKSYDSQVFTCSVSYPACVQIRERAVRFDMDKKYPDFYNSGEMELQETALNKAWKWRIKNKIASKLKKKFELSESCAFSINILMQYDLDKQELQILTKMAPEYFNKRETQHRKFNGELFSRKGVMDVLSNMKPGIFKEHYLFPPKISDQQLYCAEITCYHSPIYFAGRYNKYSRELPQTPWIIDGVRHVESSVQDIIFEPLQTFLNVTESSLKFSASGREDVDVRCLGNGRPFYIEYINPKITQLTYKQFREVENNINKSNDVKIKYLQIVSKDELVNVKKGEDSKTKEYAALCVRTPEITSDQIELLNTLAPIVIKQKTPLRVLHRRSLSIREKTINTLRAEKVQQDHRLFKIHVNTQAGTYVKEFVHGDFGRTTPNIDCLIEGNDQVDIISLDVIAVNLDWPPKPVPD